MLNRNPIYRLLAGFAAPLGVVQMTTAGARVVDPVLTNIARGYRNADFVGGALFPHVPVAQRGGKIITFGKESFRLYATGRAPGSNTRRVQFGYAGAAFALEQHALEGQVPFEIMQDANAVPGVDMARVAVFGTQNIIGLRLEKAQADLATNAGNYAAGNKKTTLAGNTLWDSGNAASNPIGDVAAAREAVRAKIGRYPNTLLLSALTMTGLQSNPQIIERIKYTGRDVPTAELLAKLFQVERIVVGGAVYADAADAFVDVWGKCAVLAYTDKSGISDMGLPSYGYTYQLGGFPIVEQPYQDRNAKSWIYPVTDEVQPVIAGAEAGYLIKPTVA